MRYAARLLVRRPLEAVVAVGGPQRPDLHSAGDALCALHRSPGRQLLPTRLGKRRLLDDPFSARPAAVVRPVGLAVDARSAAAAVRQSRLPVHGDVWPGQPPPRQPLRSSLRHHLDAHLDFLLSSYINLLRRVSYLV